MTGNINYEYITEYIRGLLPQSNADFKEMEKYALENHVPIIEKETAQFLKCLMYMIKPKKILEIGTAIGYSSLMFSEFLCRDGLIITVENDEDMVDIARENIKKHKKDDVIKVIYDDAFNVLNNIDGEFDVIFLDANKSYYKIYLPDCLRILKNGGIIISDNILYKGMIASKDELIRRKRTLVNNLREYLFLITHDERLTTSIIPIGDGVALSIKKYAEDM